jgi:hypothetical protein
MNIAIVLKSIQIVERIFNGAIQTKQKLQLFLLLSFSLSLFLSLSFENKHFSQWLYY